MEIAARMMNDPLAMDTTARMNDPSWVACLGRAKATQKYQFEAIHVLAPFRSDDGVAPVAGRRVEPGERVEQGVGAFWWGDEKEWGDGDERSAWLRRRSAIKCRAKV